MAVDHLIKRQNVQSTKVTMKITPTATILLISGFLSTSFARSIVDHDEDDHALRRLSSSGKGGSSNNDGRRNARRICKWLLQFDADGRGYGNDPTIPGFEWDSCCDVVANKQHKLCPKPAVVDEVSHCLSCFQISCTDAAAFSNLTMCSFR